MSKSKKPKPRPAFAEWLWLRDLTYRDAAEDLPVSHETIRLMCLPFSDARRRVPSVELAALITTYTGGAITRADFFPPPGVANALQDEARP